MILGMSGRLTAEPMFSVGPAMFMASMKSWEEALVSTFKSALNPFFSADGCSGAFEQFQTSNHVAHDRDDLGVVEAALARGHIWRVICLKHVFVLLNVDESFGHLLEQHGAFSLKTRSTIPEPPLHVAGRPCCGVERVHGTLRGNGERRGAHRESRVRAGDGALHCCLCILAEGASCGLNVEDQSRHALSRAPPRSTQAEQHRFKHPLDPRWLRLSIFVNAGSKQAEKHRSGSHLRPPGGFVEPSSCRDKVPTPPMDHSVGENSQKQPPPPPERGANGVAQRHATPDPPQRVADGKKGG